MRELHGVVTTCRSVFLQVRNGWCSDSRCPLKEFGSKQPVAERGLSLPLREGFSHSREGTGGVLKIKASGC